MSQIRRKRFGSNAKPLALFDGLHDGVAAAVIAEGDIGAPFGQKRCQFRSDAAAAGDQNVFAVQIHDMWLLSDVQGFAETLLFDLIWIWIDVMQGAEQLFARTSFHSYCERHR